PAPFTALGEDETRAPRGLRKGSAPGNPAETVNRLWASVGSIVCTILFAIGTVLAVLFLFLPVIDHMRYIAKQAEIDAGDAKERRDLEKKAEVPQPFPGGPAGPPAESSSAWKSKRKDLEKERDEINTNAKGRLWFYTIGMMLAVFSLSIASIGYLSSFQSTP